MANLVEVSQWEAGTYRIETTDDVIGGENGISNISAKQLGNRTRFLFDRLKDSGLNFAIDTGTLNAFVANVPSAPTAWVDGAEYRFTPALSNTAASTFTPNNAVGGLAPVPVYAGDEAATQGGEITAGGSVSVRFKQALNAGAGGVVIIASTKAIQRGATPPSGDSSSALATMAALFTAGDGMAAVNVAGAADVALTKAQYGNAMLNLTGTPTAGVNLLFPAQTGQWVVLNQQGGSFNVTAKTIAGGSIGVVIPQGVAVILYSDGTNIGLASASGQASFRTIPITGVSGTTLTISGGYTVGAILIEKNGALLEPTTDFTATNGATVSLVVAAGPTDRFNAYAFASFSVANAILKSGDDMIGPLTVLPATSAANPAQLAQLTGVVGAARNAFMSVNAASVIATFTADQIIVGSALNGLQYSLSSFNRTINLTTVGAGGMDVGAAPASGFVALYAIYNPATLAANIIAINATSAVAPEVYSNGNMPAGYTASALIGVWPTNSSGQFVVGVQADRNIGLLTVNVLTNTSQVSTPTLLSIPGAVPINAKTIDGFLVVDSTAAGLTDGSIAATASNIGVVRGGTGSSHLTVPFSRLTLVTPQQVYYTFTASAGTPSDVIGITGYSI